MLKQQLAPAPSQPCQPDYNYLAHQIKSYLLDVYDLRPSEAADLIGFMESQAKEIQSLRTKGEK